MWNEHWNLLYLSFNVFAVWRVFKMVNGETFQISYYAKKHGKFITRNGKWNDKCKYWFSKSLKPLITYFDVDANNYRTASGSYWIKRGGTNGDS